MIEAKLGAHAQAYVEHSFEYGGIAVWLLDRATFSNDKKILRFAQAETIEPGSCFPAPSMRLRTECAQQLFDGLWQRGFRPSERYAVGAESAQGEHIKDLRHVTHRLLDALHPKVSP